MVGIDIDELTLTLGAEQCRRNWESGVGADPAEDITITQVICDLIGYERLDEICATLGGTRWSVPLHPPKELRNERIRQEFDLLMTVKARDTTTGVYNALAIKYRLTPDHIRKIIARREKVQ